jgi:hypothetical protein
MKLLFCSRVEDADVLKGMLAEEGIECEITNYENPLPGAEFYPKVWVAEADFAAASAILSEFRNPSPAKLGPWTCSACGEAQEGQFTSCWKCGVVRNDVA